uniref:Cyclopropane-fatty-acyl-phospholipid synthase n=2 Tax=Tetraselmis sp. GSL018 TaxID=582737 RepID=A0A061R6F4_9CHLO
MGLFGALFDSLYDSAFKAAVAVIEKDVVPDFIIRSGIRYLLSTRLAQESKDGEKAQKHVMGFVEELKGMPLAIETDAANEQHYEVPTEYFLLCLGKNLKYSSCIYPRGNETLSEAEEAMLELYCQRAQLQDGQDVLELGCGWGSLCLFVAGKYPNSRVTAVSNSKTQKALIDQRAKERGITNLTVLTENMVNFQTTKSFDRVVSVEMFEHMKNYRELMRRISGWLKPGGLLFVHIFVHRRFPYHFEVEREDDWMAKYFFSGGTMPSLDLLLYFQEHLACEGVWYINGSHYSKTLEAWLERQDRNRGNIMPIFQETYGAGEARKWWVYWRLFYLACSELFNYSGGNEWGVGHYVFRKR